ncbi:hypothetical protein VPARA_11700 [Variovorax paradoxus]|uniref:Uncharacterized protein n=1 Tax=Variovorax paradoxus TaxID=34073 RepID=A0A0H2MAF9_VARPD|nr:hypothetical protein VPARA_11700 [Variovorax paradoxus]
MPGHTGARSYDTHSRERTQIHDDRSESPGSEPALDVLLIVCRLVGTVSSLILITIRES